MAKRTSTSMTINVPVNRAREFFGTSFCDSAEASFATAPGNRGTEVTLTDSEGKSSYGDLREALRRAKQLLEAREIPTNAHRAKVIAR
jgi:hypothetical protein